MSSVPHRCLPGSLSEDNMGTLEIGLISSACGPVTRGQHRDSHSCRELHGVQKTPTALTSVLLSCCHPWGKDTWGNASCWGIWPDPFCSTALVLLLLLLFLLLLFLLLLFLFLIFLLSLLAAAAPRCTAEELRGIMTCISSCGGNREQDDWLPVDLASLSAGFLSPGRWASSQYLTHLV